MLSVENVSHPPSLQKMNSVSHANLITHLPPMTTQLSQPKTILVLSGPAGSGKITVASHLSQKLDISYLEGDDYHSATNKVKMSNGIPLNDADRWDWLITLRLEAMKRLHEHDAVIVTCSALRRKYRDVFRIAHYENPMVRVHFIHLKVEEQHLQARIQARVGHYMKESMIRSQMKTLEEPGPDEFDVFRLEVLQQNQGAVCHQVLAWIQAKLKA